MMFCMEADSTVTELALSLVTRRLYRPQLDCTSPQPEGTHISCLYPEILALIFSYLDVQDKGRAAQVCVSWREASYHKSVWRGVEAKLHLRRANPSLFTSLVRRGIRRVQILSLRRTLRDVIQGIPNLERLNLSGCYNITDIGLSQAFVATVPSLTTLDLSLCKQVTDSGLGRIVQYLPNLEVLDLAGCSNITNAGLIIVAWGLKKLKRLDLRSCWHISNKGICQLVGLESEPSAGNLDLEYLGLQDCQRLSDEALKHISLGLTKLQKINLSFCINVTDSGLKYLAKMPSLRHLNLRSCDNITDTGLAYLVEGGSRITYLDVSFCDKVGDPGLAHISQGLFQLQFLSLNACNITDDGIIKIAKTLHDLETLQVGQCTKITDTALLTIADSFAHLRSIDLYGCSRLTSVGIDGLSKLPQLMTINRDL